MSDELKRELLAFIRSQACGGSNFNSAAEHIAEQVERWLATQPADATEAPELPPLPEERVYRDIDGDWQSRGYSADQLRAYAREAVAAALAAQGDEPSTTPGAKA